MSIYIVKVIGKYRSYDYPSIQEVIICNSLENALNAKKDVVYESQKFLDDYDFMIYDIDNKEWISTINDVGEYDPENEFHFGFKYDDLSFQVDEWLYIKITKNEISENNIIIKM